MSSGRLTTPAHRRWLASPLLVSVLGLAPAACGSDGDDGDSDDDGAVPDAGGLADAAPGVDANLSFECPDGNFGALGEVQNATSFQAPNEPSDPDGPQSRFLYGDLSATMTFALVLVDGRGAFAGGTAEPDTFELGGVEASINTCGLCMVLDVVTDEAAFAFIPTAGSATIDSVDVNLTGSAAGLELQQIDPDSGNLIQEGCTATADSVSFTVALPEDPPL